MIITTLLRVLGREFARPVRHSVVLMVAAAVAEGLSYALLVPALIHALDGDVAGSRPWLLAFGGALLLFAVLRYVADVSGFRAGSTLLAGMYRRLGDQLAALPIGWHQPARVGEMSALASGGVLQAMSVIAHLLAPLVSSVVTPVTIVGVLLAYQWQLGVAMVVAAPLIAVVYRWAGRATRTAEGQRVAAMHSATARLVEYVQAQPVLRAGDQSEDRLELLDRSLRDLERTSRRSTLAALPGAVTLSLVVQVAFTAVLATGVYVWLRGDVSAPEILALLVVAVRCTEPLLSLSELAGQITGARTVLVKLDEVLRAEPLSRPAKALPITDHELAFDSVTARRGGKTVLDDVSLSVPEGERLAVVGPSGAGKSSLLQLIPRFYDAAAGAVRVGGIDVRDLDPDDLIARVSIVSQRVYLFDGTIEDNLRLARPDADDEQMTAAISAARLDEVVASLPDGLGTQVGEGGARLSGGERQRVAIARALLKDAPIVLLDEITSALDPINEAAVHAGIEHLITGRTVVMVAHRLRTIHHADRVVFLDQGRVVEQGSHEELLERSERYAQFWATSLSRA